jgi:DNA-binding response OmpR family regulator
MPSAEQRMNKRILFVDDEAAIRATLPVVLRKHGFDVTVASTVPEAIEQVQTHAFDLLLCDLNIGRERDGYDVVRAMHRSQPRSAVVILTGYPGLESAITGIREGVDDYLIKPSDTDELIARLDARLAHAQGKARILSVSHDQLLLRMRHLLLEREGYEVVSAQGLTASLEACKEVGFDLLVLGHSLEHAEKQQIVDAFRSTSDAPVVSLRRNAGEQLVRGAQYYIEPDPDPMLKLIAEILSRRPPARTSDETKALQ